MNSYRSQILNLLKQITFVFVLYSICRILFYAFNHSSFQDITTTELLSILFYGLRFDAFSVAATNALYILLCSLPFKFYYSKIYQKITSIVFIITNGIALSLNFIDFAYFPFIQKRTTYDVGNLVFGGQTEFINLIPHFIADFWYILLLFIICIWGLITIHLKIKRNQTFESAPLSVKKISYSFLVFILISGTTVLGIRGGLQRIPIVLMDAANYTNPKYIPIIINTPFSILKSADLTEIKPLNFYNETELNNYYSPIHQADTGLFKNDNVCVIILESFSKEFTGISNRKSYTPFLDSLISQSILFTNAISNGKTSVNGIPAITASMPCFLENQYLNSMYSNNALQTLPNLLKTKGYNSVFYHGGSNGTMNFNSYAQLAGYDSYYGRNEYNNDIDYDGQWGIWDEPFLKKTATEISTLKQPFFTSIFTLSSHNPYLVPEKYKNKFPKGNYEIHQCVGYTDYSLKQFFEEAKKQPWFKNTLFVITPDHTATSEDPFYSNIVGQHSIPILFYKQNIQPTIITKTVQNIDILPTILDYLNFDKPYYSFGQSMFSSKTQPVIFYNSPYYCCIADSNCYIINNYKITEKYNYKIDSLLQKNENINSNDNELLKFCKAYIQCYTNDVIKNKTYYNNTK
jgi:phosphoglycerol transferase MdoB-like AlkP superfamily enzyme